jgi:hypothetical protein
MNDNEFMLPPAGPEAEELPLRLLEDILCNRIMQKKQEMHKTKSRADADRIWTEIETLQWILSESFYQKKTWT